MTPCHWLRTPTPAAGLPHIAHRPRIGWHHTPRRRPRVWPWLLVCAAVPVGGAVGGLLSMSPLAMARVVAVPEPSGLAVLATGIGLLAGIRRGK